MKLLIIGFIGCMLMVIGIRLMFYAAYHDQKMTIQEAISCLGDKGGTLYLRPGAWIITDKMVKKVKNERRY